MPLPPQLLGKVFWKSFGLCTYVIPRLDGCILHGAIRCSHLVMRSPLTVWFPFLFDAPSLSLFDTNDVTRQVSAQDCWTAGNGAYTGETSADMLKDMGVGWCIIGHSERRQKVSGVVNSTRLDVHRLLLRCRMA